MAVILFEPWMTRLLFYRGSGFKRFARAIATRDSHRTVDGGKQGTILGLSVSGRRSGLLGVGV